jgi:endothelin-converting enzyme
VVIIQASPAGISLPSPEYYKDEGIMQKYQATVQAVLGAFVPGFKSVAGAGQQAAAVVALEKKIAAITPPPEDQQDVTVSITENSAICNQS